MRNFMCYRDNVPPLSFDNIHTACICGNNGNGKSALIDAMTWALWGETRAKSDDELVHQGQAEMQVEFDFTVGEQRYRIIRKHARPKGRGRSGQSLLELQIATDDGFRSISGDSKTQTQERIINLLHMDYDTFINSAFLRQGRADEFTKNPPAKRKQVLADILGLAFYDELEERAKELAKKQEADGEQLESAIREIEEELAKKPTYEAELGEAEARLNQIERVITKQETRLNSLRREKEALENKRQQLTLLEEHITTTKKESERREQEIKQYQSQIKEYEAVIAERPTIEKGYSQLTEAKRLFDELDQKFRQSVNLEKQKSQLESRIKDAGQSLINEHAVAQSRISELETISQKLPQLKSELQQAKAELSQLAEKEETLNRKKQTSQELRRQVSYIESTQARLEQEIAEIEEKINLLSTQAGAKCPLCDTPLGSDGLKRIELNYAADKAKRADAIKKSQSELSSKKTELESVEGEISQLEALLNQEKTKAQSQVNIIRKEIAETEAASNQLAELRQGLAELELRLARKEFAASEQKALAEIDQELARLEYDPQQYEQVRHRLSELEKFEDQKRKLEEADRLISQVTEALGKAEEASQELQLRLEAENKKAQELSRELEALPQLTTDLAQAEAEYQTLAAQQKQAQETVWNVKQKLEHCAELEIKKREKEQLLAQTSREGKIYNELAQAFGKKGIQALLIETALPEIEAEANKLLSRMTDNRMHVKIETQKPTRKGELVETLDITIADELGTRDYEMFSGGEAFRINFAIRVALSKLLARRAGAQIRTLIIDEGFGTQDISGIEKIKEAINSIQDDFDRILVITHIEELRDAFPSRIDVIKTAHGSNLEVN